MQRLHSGHGNIGEILSSEDLRYYNVSVLLLLSILLQILPDGLHFPLSFEWNKEASMHQGMQFGAAIIVGNHVYCQSNNVVNRYDPATDTWIVLPDVPVTLFSIASLNEQLVAVGGLDEGSRITTKAKTIYALGGDSTSWKWTTLPGNPSLPSGVSRPGCGSYEHYLIVAGGYGSRLFSSSVAVFDTKEGSWYSASPLPETGDIVGTVIIGEHLYLLLSQEGLVKPTKMILTASMKTLTTQAKSGKNEGSSIWKKLPDIPDYIMTGIFSIGNNMLLTITVGDRPFQGIMDMLPIARTDIHIFNPYTKQWLKVGELPEVMVRCACTMLPSGKLLVAGGSTGVRVGQKLVSSVYTAETRR